MLPANAIRQSSTTSKMRNCRSDSPNGGKRLTVWASWMGITGGTANWLGVGSGITGGCSPPVSGWASIEHLSTVSGYSMPHHEHFFITSDGRCKSTHFGATITHERENFYGLRCGIHTAVVRAEGICWTVILLPEPLFGDLLLSSNPRISWQKQLVVGTADEQQDSEDRAMSAGIGILEPL